MLCYKTNDKLLCKNFNIDNRKTSFIIKKINSEVFATRHNVEVVTIFYVSRVARSLSDVDAVAERKAPNFWAAPCWHQNALSIHRPKITIRVTVINYTAQKQKNTRILSVRPKECSASPKFARVPSKIHVHHNLAVWLLELSPHRARVAITTSTAPPH